MTPVGVLLRVEPVGLTMTMAGLTFRLLEGGNSLMWLSVEVLREISVEQNNYSTYFKKVNQLQDLSVFVVYCQLHIYYLYFYYIYGMLVLACLIPIRRTSTARPQGDEVMPRHASSEDPRQRKEREKREAAEKKRLAQEAKDKKRLTALRTKNNARKQLSAQEIADFQLLQLKYPKG